MTPVGPTPRLLLLVPIVAAAIWWPIDAYWASDDFLALHYAQELSRAASDLVGPQYAATDVWSFYRPLITLSFWFDQAAGGPWPPFAHASNAVAHGLSALLVALIWRRFLPDGSAALAAVAWAMMPGHVGSVAWAVGRVDSHTTVWCLASLWLCLRAVEGRGPRWLAALALVLALMSKELAFVVPPLASLLALAGSERETFGERARDAVRASWPLWLVLVLYLPFRLWTLGRFGGYDAAELAPLDALRGLGDVVLDELVPLRWIGAPPDGGVAPPWAFLAAAAAPVAIALLVAVVRRPGLVATATVAFALALAPMVQFLSASENPHNLRYYYLPATALVGALAAGGRLPLACVVLAWAWPLVAVRTVQREADLQDRAMHAAMLREADEAPAGPMFVAGLPHNNREGTAVQLHFGVDRMLRPPFRDEPRALYALRPLLQQPDAFRLGPRDEPPFALPEGSTWWFPDATALGRAPEPAPLPDLRVVGDDDGVVDMTTPRLEPWIERYPEMIAQRQRSYGLEMPDVQAQVLRVTVFTANGYLCCLCPNHALPGDAGSRFDVVRFFAGDAKNPPPMALPAFATRELDPEKSAKIGDQLVVPTTIDLDPEFPVLLEAGSVDLPTLRFTPTHRCRRLLRFRFDRDYPKWVRHAQGTDR